MLRQLCAVYNGLRTQVISTQEQHQEMLDGVEARARDVTFAVELLQQLEFNATQCLKLAQEEIDARGSKPNNTVMVEVSLFDTLF